MRAMGLLCSFGEGMDGKKRFMWRHDDLMGGRSWRFTVPRLVQVTFFTQSRKYERREVDAMLAYLREEADR